MAQITIKIKKMNEKSTHMLTANEIAYAKYLERKLNKDVNSIPKNITKFLTQEHSKFINLKNENL
jgi:hypothetical protein